MAERLPDEAMSRNAGWDMYLGLYQDSKRAVPMPMTGYEALCQFRAVEDDQDSTLLATATIVVGTMDVNELFTPDPDGEWLLLSLTQAQIAAVTAGEMFADVLIKAAGSDPRRYAKFKAIVGDGESVWPT
jgi:hypothetical protein